MCGITGILHFDKERPVDRNALKAMTDIIHHRGPDGEGFFIEKNVGLGHRRLSIIDLKTGDQPMHSNDGKKVIVFNGEIYNYIEIREELKEKGYIFQTESDTEVILNAYEEWGIKCQERFNGMWAFALWDKIKGEVFLSRDRIGEKPLHYAVYDNTFVFGSELKSLFNYGVPKVPDLSLIEIYLVLTNVPEPYTFFKNVFKLKAGHYLRIKNDKIEQIKYWDMPELDESKMSGNKEDVYEQFEYLFKDAVKIRMRSDVPFGAFLSGGLDSSSVVSVMSAISKFPINTFTIGFPEREFDESLLADEVAKKFGTKHYLGTVYPDEFNEIIKKITFHYDEPFGDSSAIPTSYVSKFAREKVKMVLTGDGGDEVLSGYNSYVGIKITQEYQKLPKFLQQSIPKGIYSLKRFTKGSNRLKLNKMESIATTALLSFDDRIIQKKSYVDFPLIKSLTAHLPDNYKIEDYFSDFIKSCTYKDDFYKLMYLNFKMDLPNDYLVKVDRMSMANSLETRLPFLDYRLIEFMAGVDKGVKLQGWERKSVLRNTIGKTLPQNILKAPKKGFGIPLREWFKEDSFNHILDNNLHELKNILDKQTIEHIINENKKGLSDNGNFIWTLMLLNQSVK